MIFFGTRNTLRCASVLSILLVSKSGVAGFGDAQAVISQIERLPRSQRLIAYPAAMQRLRLTDPDQLLLVKAFAQHARVVSPYYGPTNRRWNVEHWITVLERGFQRDPNDADIARALAQLYINELTYSRALPVVEAYRQAQPSHHHANAWYELCRNRRDGTRVRPAVGEIVTFPLHFCVLTRNPAAHRVATLRQCREECDILNRTFRTRDGDALVRFEFRGYASYADISKNSACEMIRYGDSTEPYDSERIARAFNSCRDQRVRDPSAINVYIFDSYSGRAKYKDVTSHGKRNSNRPYVLLDWARLDNKIQNPEAHEMGHAFGLGHVGVPGAKLETPTNIMSSAGERFGSGGSRTLGFTEAQAAVIVYHAQRTCRRLGRAE